MSAYYNFNSKHIEIEYISRNGFNETLIKYYDRKKEKFLFDCLRVDLQTHNLLVAEYNEIAKVKKEYNIDIGNELYIKSDQCTKSALEQI
jgi:hypothetical protein